MYVRRKEGDLCIGVTDTVPSSKGFVYVNFVSEQVGYIIDYVHVSEIETFEPANDKQSRSLLALKRMVQRG